MKKLVLLAVFLLAATAVFAQADLSSLPSGAWVDANWNATWTFGATGIVLSTPADGTIYTFTTRNIRDLKAVGSGLSVGVAFSCDGTGRTYTFLPRTDGTMVMQIDRAGQTKYEVTMQKK